MSLKLRDFAKSDGGSANLLKGNLEESSDEDISYLPAGKTITLEVDILKRHVLLQSLFFCTSILPQPQQLIVNLKCVLLESREKTRENRDDRSYSEVPYLKDEKPWFGPEDQDGSIKVQYPSTINGYGVDSRQMQQMERMGLPTGFSFGHAPPERQKKGEKKTFFCQICLIELNSLDTMKSHVAGVSQALIMIRCSNDSHL